MERVDVKDPAVLVDVDTRRDYDQAREMANCSPGASVNGG